MPARSTAALIRPERGIRAKGSIPKPASHLQRLDDVTGQPARSNASPNPCATSPGQTAVAPGRGHDCLFRTSNAEGPLGVATDIYIVVSNLLFNPRRTGALSVNGGVRWCCALSRLFAACARSSRFMSAVRTGFLCHLNLPCNKVWVGSRWMTQTPGHRSRIVCRAWGLPGKGRGPSSACREAEPANRWLENAPDRTWAVEP